MWNFLDHFIGDNHFAEIAAFNRLNSLRTAKRYFEEVTTVLTSPRVKTYYENFLKHIELIGNLPDDAIINDPDLRNRTIQFRSYLGDEAARYGNLVKRG